jgi:23S rRNA pseudouridine2605 synthase
MEERLQKILARAGLGSRRASEELISSGRVRVNGQVAVLGSKADPERDRIEVDGRPINLAEPLAYIAIYKPRGVISAVQSPDPRPTVRDLVPVPGHLYPVGRLDIESEGLMLLTNDGELANRLTHPRYGHEKEYRVLVARRPDEEQLETWRRGVVLEDGYRTRPAEVRFESIAGKGTWLRVIMREGRKRQIRETGQLLGLPVVKIIRVRIGTLQLGSLKPREWRHLSQAEVASLKGETEKSDPGRGKGKAIPEKAKPGPPTRGRPGKSGETSRPRGRAEKGKRRNL